MLDPGSGRGIFLFEAYRRLLELGASVSTARASLFGIEKNRESYQAMRANLSPLLGGEMPNIREGDLFHATFPEMDAVIGNPPYVRRWWLQDLDFLRERVAEKMGGSRLTRLTDLACYFVIYAADFLRPGGRLALVVTDGWLDADYGTAFKEYLLSNFDVQAVAAFRSRVFDGALIRPVLLLAEKRVVGGRRSSRNTLFALLSPSDLPHLKAKHLITNHLQAAAIRCVAKPSSDLPPEVPWTPFFTAPPAYSVLAESGLAVPLRALAASRIGIQTFAKPVFILRRSEAEALNLEREFFRPILVSSRDSNRPILDKTAGFENVLFCCNQPPDRLQGTNVLEYIRRWESRPVSARGLRGQVVGAQNLPRLRRAGRIPWYNIQDEVERRGSWPILLPRRIFRKYMVLWNLAGWIANENFIELTPREGILIEPLLAVLNSSFSEMSFRVNAHMYGGGIYNLNPGDVGGVPVLDVRHLNSQSVKSLRSAYDEFSQAGALGRQALDAVVVRTLRVPRAVQEGMDDALTALRAASVDVKNFAENRNLRLVG